jgi:hypothetical protein
MYDQSDAVRYNFILNIRAKLYWFIQVENRIIIAHYFQVKKGYICNLFKKYRSTFAIYLKKINERN